jgi:carboxyl-terminal processing protease
MERAIPKILIGPIAVMTAVVVYTSAALADGPSTPRAPSPKPPPELAKRVQEITDAVLEHHIDPPARQQMILSGIKALYHAAGVPVPSGLSRRVSALATPEQLVTFLADAWPKATAKLVEAKPLEDALLNGLLRNVPGGAELISDKERKVVEQFESNRYVGIHIALGMDDQEKRPTFMDVFEGGPADRAGAKKHDLLEQIDGVDTKGMNLRQAVDRLRGAEGTEVTIKVRQPKESKTRTMKITRGQHPHPTIVGVRKRSSGEWEVRRDGPDPIGYLKITEIAASTPHELRKMAQHLESQGARALILDLRGHIRGNSVHPAVLLADCLLDRGPIGRLRTSRGETTYQAEPDALFRGWPIAVLVDSSTTGTAEWLAAALQDNHRAVVVGTPTSGASRQVRMASGIVAPEATGVRSRVSVGDGSWSIELTTGCLERGDGRPLRGLTEVEIGDPQSFALRPQKPGKIETGVTPDHVTAPPTRTSLPERVSARIQGQAREPVAGSDPEMKAVELLRQSLKKI